MGMQRLYNWVLRQAEKPYAEFILFAVAFVESSFFPIPPDVMLLPMALVKRAKAWRFAALCTAGSVFGALLGYAIGALAMATLGDWIIRTYHLQDAFQKFHDQFNEWGVVVILIKGLTPIPFKLVTIASGVAGLNIVHFILACALTRAFRFYLVAALAYFFGDPIRTFVEKYLNWVVLGVLLVCVLGFWIALR